MLSAHTSKRRLVIFSAHMGNPYNNPNGVISEIHDFSTGDKININIVINPMSQVY